MTEVKLMRQMKHSIKQERPLKRLKLHNTRLMEIQLKYEDALNSVTIEDKYVGFYQLTQTNTKPWLSLYQIEVIYA